MVFGVSSGAFTMIQPPFQPGCSGRRWASSEAMGEHAGAGRLAEHVIPIRPPVAFAVQPLADVVVDFYPVEGKALGIVEGVARPERMGQDDQPTLGTDGLDGVNQAHFGRDALEAAQSDDVEEAAIDLAVQLDAVQPEERRGQGERRPGGRSQPGPAHC